VQFVDAQVVDAGLLEGEPGSFVLSSLALMRSSAARVAFSTCFTVRLSPSAWILVRASRSGLT
jgi:hypothetical protein